MTKLQIRNYIEKINEFAYEEGMSYEVSKVKAQYLSDRGFRRQYLVTRDSKATMEEYLECLINACYDVIGRCI